MAELVHAFTTMVAAMDGRVYTAEAWGVLRDDGLWEGSLVFTPDDGGPRLTTARETTQSNFNALAYWAHGLEPVYLEGALARARPEESSAA
ncbi:MAG TPA: hypothetical protein VGL09_06505 [Methylomirabilota bacterium]|jgi:hypothetical protein